MPLPSRPDALALLKQHLQGEYVLRHSLASEAVRDEVVYCEACFNISTGPQCPICLDPGRDDDRLCVVEEPVKTVGTVQRADRLRIQCPTCRRAQARE